MEQGTNKSYRIRTEINKDSNVIVNFTQEYETFELLSIKLKTENLYRLHNANYGIVVGRVQANGGFGVPNAKISIFIEADQENENSELLAIYGYTDVFQTNSLGNTYNLLPDEQVSDCHKKIGAFPNKRYLLDNDTYIEVYDKYYKYTTRTNNAGDYIIVGVPIGNQTLHMDLDLSDCGILSQRPRDFVYKGYNIEQFDNPNQFKSETGTSINFLSQYVQQTKTIYVNPLWGNNDLGETLGITRADIDVNFKFEPTCVFMGSVVSDSRSNGMTMKCVPTDQMGVMDELTTGKGTIEMIRKTPTNGVEEFQIKGNELIDGNGTWCYQIPMNLDYVTTNEYGETVATDNPNIGIPTRARVRFRVSLDNFEDSNDNFFAGKVLVPNNPGVVNENGIDVIDYDYAFGTETGEDSYRDLFWNNVYSVKQHIPRIQKSGSWRTDRFTGIKQCNFYGQNNPIPYNSIRIKLPFMFVVLCALIKTYVRIVSFLNAIINAFFRMLSVFIGLLILVVVIVYPILFGIWLVLQLIDAILSIFGESLDLDGLEKILELDIKKWPVTQRLKNIGYITIADGICPDLETWYFAPMIGSLGYCPVETVRVVNETYSLCQQTIDKISDGGYEDATSTDYSNKDTGVGDKICITRNVDYLMTCIEMNLAQEYKVIKFDFYNDWINGMLYIPRWKFRPEHKITFLFGLIKFKVKTKGCFDDNTIFGRTRWLTQHCSLGYKETKFNGVYRGYATIGTTYGCSEKPSKQKCHKTPGIRSTAVFGYNGGMVHRETTMLGQSVYYYKPSEMSSNLDGKQTKINMFATDIVLLGSLKDCDENGIPQAFKWLSSSSYKMPTNLALTNLDESGVVFVDGDSYCVGGNDENNIETRKVGKAENTFSGQVKWSSSAPVEIQIMGYEKSPNSVGDIVKISSDRIAITEAAGVSWDYTGPSQAEREKNDLFSPGGHFLGMSCVNSKTNIKSCVNLQRICEAGATMSERIERTRGFKVDSDGNYSQQSVVFSPNGLISTDEIIAGSFRNMFATMNLSHLIATKKDKNTGYLRYDFSYVRANGFDGSSYQNIVKKSDYYNRKIGDFIPDDYVYDNTEDDTISYEIKKEIEEAREHTYHRSIEAANFGYYRFRFGLKESDEKKFNELSGTKYALTLNGLKYLPQYENSFYFYFGLKDGNTAIDRFYSDFFSMCQTRNKGKNPSFSVRNSGMDYCTKEQSIWVTSEEVEYPYDLILTNGEATITANGITYKSIQICGLVPGIWEINVSDSNGFSVTKKVKIGANIKGINYTFNDFKENLKSGGKQKYVLNDEGVLCHSVKSLKGCIRPKGGEFTFNISDITVFGKGISSLVDDDGAVQDAGLLFVSSDSNSPSKSDHAVMLRYEGNKEFSWTTFNSGDFYNSSVTGNDEKDRHRTDFEFGEKKDIEGLGSGAVKIDNTKHDVTFYLWQDKKYYTLYFIYKCNNGADSKYLALELCKVYSIGYEAFNVYLGSKFLKYNGENEEGFSLSEFLKTNISDTEVLSSIKDEDGDGKTITKWALRQALYDQRYDITIDSSDRQIRCTNLKGQYIDGISFGQPEKAVINDGVVSYSAFTNYYGTVLSSDDYAFYKGFEVDDTASLLPSMSYVPGENLKLPYFKMSIDNDYNLILSDPISAITISGVTESGDTVEKFAILKIDKNLLTTFSSGRGYILKSQNDENLIIECSFVRPGVSGFVVPMSTLTEKGIDINTQISGTTFDVHSTLCVPIIHKPFYFDAHPFILGRFTVIGTSSLTNSIKFNSKKTEYQFNCDNIGGVSVSFNLTYGDRKLSYRLKRDSSKENCVYINDYIKIYGGNACAPSYYLGDCTHFGVKLSGTGISVKSTITGSPLDTKQYIEGVYSYDPENGQPDTIEISMSTGLPTLDENKDDDKKIIQDLTALTNGDMKGLQFSTSHSLDNFLPKEIVIRRDKIENNGDVSKNALIDEECYLDVGDGDSITADDVNKNVKLYMIVIPDKNVKGATKIGKAMSTSLFNEEIRSNEDDFKTPDYYGNVLINAVYPSGKTAKDLFVDITFSDYFSNPSAVAFLFDQIIQSSVFSSCRSDNAMDERYRKNIEDLKAGKQRGGYFHKPNFDGYKDPGLVFGKLNIGATQPFAGARFSLELITPFKSGYTSIYKSFDGVHYEDGKDLETPITHDNTYSVISGNGSTENADICHCLTEEKHWNERKPLIDLIKETELYKNMSKFGYTIDLINKFYVDKTNYHSSGSCLDASLYALGDTLSEDFGVNFKNEKEQMEAMEKFYTGTTGSCGIGGLKDTPISNVWFDEIIGKNWAFPNLEYTVDKNIVSNVTGTCKYFSESIESEYDSVYNNNKNESEGETLETPNYAGIIASFFINNSFNANGETESETLVKLFNGAADGKYESFIVPITLGKNMDENGKVKSSFNWPVDSEYVEKLGVYRDKKWVVNANTEWALGHENGAKEIISSIEDSIYDENMSYGFRSVIIGIYDGPGITNDETKNGNRIRPFKIYTFHSKGLYSNRNFDSKFSSSHEINGEFSPNEYYNKRADKNDSTITKQRVENLHLYYYHKYENDYDKYASGWC